ncbi:MAG: hypothetical protein MUC67_01285 [Acidobacteria bacterium]|jgi:hypothetical protein|nr:hypothetical protein [Acidobacteriota bacterium]MCU0252924.1 hypothetical protein [Acidobacteriota bacterium]
MAGSTRDQNLHLHCPLCRGTLIVDRETGAVIDATAPAGAKKDFEDVLGDLRSADARREQDFSQAFKVEKKRTDLLDRKFEAAKEKAEKDPKKRVNPMDYD